MVSKQGDMNEWLKEDSRKIIYLFQLARGLHPLDRINWPPKYPWDVRWQDLKNAIDTGKLAADFANQANKNIIVSLAGFWAFSSGQGEEWQWARDFCHRWAKVRGEVLPQSQPPDTDGGKGGAEEIHRTAKRKIKVRLNAFFEDLGRDWFKARGVVKIREALEEDAAIKAAVKEKKLTLPGASTIHTVINDWAEEKGVTIKRRKVEPRP